MHIRVLSLVLLLMPSACAEAPQEPAPPVEAPPAPAPPLPPAQPTEQIIEGERKTALGVLRDLQAGDVACYADFVDDAGEPFHEMAFFEVCDQTELIGRRVALTYEMGNVLAASCEGDMDCGKSDYVALIVDMQLATDANGAALPDPADAFFGASLTGFTHEDGFRPYGYFQPQQVLTIDGTTFYGIALPADVNERYDTGEGMAHTFIIDFERGGGYLKAFPDAYRLTRSEVWFDGPESELGRVLFKGQFDTEALEQALASGQHTGPAPLLTGTLQVGGQTYTDLTFSWSGQ